MQGISTHGANLIFSQSKIVVSSNIAQGAPFTVGPSVCICIQGMLSRLSVLEGFIPSSQYICQEQSKFSLAAPIIRLS